MTTEEKTLKALREAGPKGIHSFELNERIQSFRSVARIKDLRDKGYTIISKPEKLGNANGVRYFLTNEPNHLAVKNRPFKWVFEGNVARREYL